MDAVPSNVGPFGFKFYQVGMYVRDVQEAKDHYASLGCSAWSFDELSHHGLSNEGSEWRPYTTYGELAFNYELLPIELELLSFDDNDPRMLERLRSRQGDPVTSHMCVRVDNIGKVVRRMARVQLMSPYIAFVSDEHSNPHMADHRIAGVYYAMRGVLGYDIKVVQRIDKTDEITAADIVANL